MSGYGGAPSDGNGGYYSGYGGDAYARQLQQQQQQRQQQQQQQQQLASLNQSYSASSLRQAYDPFPYGFSAPSSQQGQQQQPSTSYGSAASQQFNAYSSANDSYSNYSSSGQQHSSGIGSGQYSGNQYPNQYAPAPSALDTWGALAQLPASPPRRSAAPAALDTWAAPAQAAPTVTTGGSTGGPAGGSGVSYGQGSSSQIMDEVFAIMGYDTGSGRGGPALASMRASELGGYASSLAHQTAQQSAQQSYLLGGAGGGIGGKEGTGGQSDVDLFREALGREGATDHNGDLDLLREALVGAHAAAPSYAPAPSYADAGGGGSGFDARAYREALRSMGARAASSQANYSAPGPSQNNMSVQAASSRANHSAPSPATTLEMHASYGIDSNNHDPGSTSYDATPSSAPEPAYDAGGQQGRAENDKYSSRQAPAAPTPAATDPWETALAELNSRLVDVSSSAGIAQIMADMGQEGATGSSAADATNDSSTNDSSRGRDPSSAAAHSQPAPQGMGYYSLPESGVNAPAAGQAAGSSGGTDSAGGMPKGGAAPMESLTSGRAPPSFAAHMQSMLQGTQGAAARGPAGYYSLPKSGVNAPGQAARSSGSAEGADRMPGGGVASVENAKLGATAAYTSSMQGGVVGAPSGYHSASKPETAAPTSSGQKHPVPEVQEYLKRTIPGLVPVGGAQSGVAEPGRAPATVPATVPVNKKPAQPRKKAPAKKKGPAKKRAPAKKKAPPKVVATNTSTKVLLSNPSSAESASASKWARPSLAESATTSKWAVLLPDPKKVAESILLPDPRKVAESERRKAILQQSMAKGSAVVPGANKPEATSTAKVAAKAKAPTKAKAPAKTADAARVSEAVRMAVAAGKPKLPARTPAMAEMIPQRKGGVDAERVSEAVKMAVAGRTPATAQTTAVEKPALPPKPAVKKPAPPPKPAGPPSLDSLRQLLKAKKSKAVKKAGVPITTATKAVVASPRPVGRPAKPRPAVVTPKEIVIPATFSPTHGYRAAAAYSLLRTLSKELRLSPFAMQAFCHALTLPIPSKLLGEIHVRVIRVLYADRRMGSYSKTGEGEELRITRRKRIAKGDDSRAGKAPAKPGDGKDEEEVVELVAKRGGDNLYFLDPTTWPLFYEDYATETEDGFLEVTGAFRDVGDEEIDEEFINVKSSAMTAMDEIDLNPPRAGGYRGPGFLSRRGGCGGPGFLARGGGHRGPSFLAQRGGDRFGLPRSPQKDDPAPTVELVQRCPAGPTGRRNAVGRFVCCPFHVGLAVRMFRGIHPPASTSTSTSTATIATPGGAGGSGRKRGRPPKTTPGGRTPACRGSAKKARRSRKSPWGGDSDSESWCSEDSEEDDFTPASGRRGRGRPPGGTPSGRANKVGGAAAARNPDGRPGVDPRPGVAFRPLPRPLPAAGTTPRNVGATARTLDVRPGAAFRPLPRPPPGAVTREDCRRCANCLDMRKYGGPGLRKQKCAMKRDSVQRQVEAPAPKPQQQTVPEQQPQQKWQGWFEVGAIVFVQDRMWPGRNDPGGVARVLAVHRRDGGVKYDVKYVVEARKEKWVEEQFVSAHAERSQRPKGEVSYKEKSESDLTPDQPHTKPPQQQSPQPRQRPQPTQPPRQQTLKPAPSAGVRPQPKPAEPPQIRGTRVMNVEVAKSSLVKKLKGSGAVVPMSASPEKDRIPSNLLDQARATMSSGVTSRPPNLLDQARARISKTVHAPSAPQPMKSQANVIHGPPPQCHAKATPSGRVDSKSQANVIHGPPPQCQAKASHTVQAACQGVPPTFHTTAIMPTNAPTAIATTTKLVSANPLIPSNTPKVKATTTKPVPANPQPQGTVAGAQRPGMRPYPSIIVPPVPVRLAARHALVVSEDVDERLEKYFFCGPPKVATSERAGEGAADGGTEDDAGPPDLFGVPLPDDDGVPAHMAPLKLLARGVPYHHLSLSSKLTVLEFLLDELLQVQEIRGEFARRQSSTLGTTISKNCGPYGRLPLPWEFDDMYNADECSVCGIEGDLLCCDGCPGSYHRGCIGMGNHQKLPEGRWLCPECKITDASKMVR